ncbi:Myb/SANT-like domain [Arabidopsis suecica]|uniref:Myb/SANT-like domain n=1 Tax=Arabidopsis suecica TaxID=45249 RepID=A0A8T2FH82_ARASU|nr:Myb/SANT-like domain [Arabidopsis suecica]
MTREKVMWEPELHKVFVDLCVEQKMLGFRLPGLNRIWESFVQNTGARFTRDQLKNHWDTMLRLWRAWCRLVECSEMKWDPQTKKFGASTEVWTNYFRVNPKAKQYRFRSSPPPFLKDLKMIFEGTDLGDEEGTSCGKRKRIPDADNDTGDEDNDTGDDDNYTGDDDITIPRYKAYWSSSSHEIFVDLLFTESLKENRPKPARRNGYYAKETWNMMVESFNQKTGLRYTRKQLKNHWNITRDAWRRWCQAVGSPLLKWDANTKTFGATSEDWENYSKENKRAEQFRLKHIPHADKLAIIFKGHVEPGKTALRPYRKRVNHHSEAPQHPAPSSALNINESVPGSEGGADDDHHIVMDHHFESPHDPAPSSEIDLNEPVTGSEGGADDDHYIVLNHLVESPHDRAPSSELDINKPVAGIEGIADDNDNHEPIPHHWAFNGVGVEESQDVETVTPAPCERINIELVEKITSSALVKEYEYTIGECMKCLNAMEEVEKGSELYMLALDLFMNKECREMFLLLETSTLRMSWLLRRLSGGSTMAA